MTLSILPHVNATLNATSAILLLSGYGCIRTRHITAHKWCMLCAVGVTACFLTSYVIYHAHVGSIRFRGAEWLRPIYFTILISHTLLAVAIVPLVLRTLFLAARSRFAENRASRSLARCHSQRAHFCHHSR